MYRRLDQPVQEPPAIGSQICLSSDCHCSSHIWSNLWNIFMQWQSEAWQLWLLRADGSCTDWSNLRHTGRIYDFRRYWIKFYGTELTYIFWNDFSSAGGSSTKKRLFADTSDSEAESSSGAGPSSQSIVKKRKTSTGMLIAHTDVKTFDRVHFTRKRNVNPFSTKLDQFWPKFPNYFPWSCPYFQLNFIGKSLIVHQSQPYLPQKLSLFYLKLSNKIKSVYEHTSTYGTEGESTSMHSGPSESSRESAKMRDTLNTFLTTINALAKTCQGKPASADGGQERRDSRSGH